MKLSNQEIYMLRIATGLPIPESDLTCPEFPPRRRPVICSAQDAPLKSALRSVAAAPLRSSRHVNFEEPVELYSSSRATESMERMSRMTGDHETKASSVFYRFEVVQKKLAAKHRRQAE